MAQTNEAIERNLRNLKELDKLSLLKLNYEEYPDDIIDTANLTADLAVVMAEENRVRINVIKMKKLGPQCPTCGQDIDNHEALLQAEEIELTACVHRTTQLEKELDEITEHNSKARKKQDILRKIADLEQKIDNTLPEKPCEESYFDGIIQAYQEKIRKTRERKKLIDEYNSTVNKHNAKMEAFKSILEERKKELEEATKKLEGCVVKATNLEVLKKVFGNSGLLAYKIENLTFHLHTLINSYLVKLSGGRFTLAFKAEKDKLNVTLTDEGKEINIQALSSGELARVNCATLLGIRSLLGSISNAKINLLILDEVINVLDVEGRQTLVEILWEEPMNTFLVSHAWTHPLLQKLEVRKEDGFSTVNYD